MANFAKYTNERQRRRKFSFTSSRPIVHSTSLRDSNPNRKIIRGEHALVWSWIASRRWENSRSDPNSEGGEEQDRRETGGERTDRKRRSVWFLVPFSLHLLRDREKHRPPWGCWIWCASCPRIASGTSSAAAGKPRPKPVVSTLHLISFLPDLHSLLLFSLCLVISGYTCCVLFVVHLVSILLYRYKKKMSCFYWVQRESG
jgi:hypothetical protein